MLISGPIPDDLEVDQKALISVRVHDRLSKKLQKIYHTIPDALEFSAQSLARFLRCTEGSAALYIERFKEAKIIQAVDSTGDPIYKKAVSLDEAVKTLRKESQ